MNSPVRVKGIGVLNSATPTFSYLCPMSIPTLFLVHRIYQGGNLAIYVDDF